MAFYLRKSFKAGPIRFNLSKSGIGVSAGVKGLRAGTGPRGAYMHAGRGGVYMRKSLGTSAVSGSRAAAVNPGVPALSGYDTEEVFVDTGVTYPSNVQRTDVKLGPIPVFPSSTTANIWLILFGTITLLITVPSSSIPGIVIGAGLIVLGIILSVSNFAIKRSKTDVEQMFRDCETKVQDGMDFDIIVEMDRFNGLNKISRRIFAYQFMVLILSSLAESINRDQYLRICILKDSLGISESDFNSVKIRIFGELFDEYFADHFLDEEEEQMLINMANILELDKKQIQNEMNSIKIMSDIRSEIQMELTEIEVPVKLSKDEKCYYASHARILKKKILRTQTIQGQKIKYVGFTIDKEGEIYLTNKRTLLVADGVTTIQHAKVINVVSTPEANIVELNIDGRKTPIILTSDNSITYAAKLEKILLL